MISLEIISTQKCRDYYRMVSFDSCYFTCGYIIEKYQGLGLCFLARIIFFSKIRGISGIYEVIKLLSREVGILKESPARVLYCFV